MDIETFRCDVCGEIHEGPPFSYGFGAPLAYYQISKLWRWFRCFLTTDTCRIDEKRFFVLGNIRIPIIGSDRTFTWGVWISLSKENFYRSLDLWDKPGREAENAYFGWLSNSIPGYPETINLKTQVHTQPVGIRPEIELEPTDHPLALEQRNGISFERVKEIASIANHYIDGSTKRVRLN
ncbi:MAG TPA: DUF2199 domain-containing protein [Acidiferrobacterales bacterium]|jgi:hypothetical protein